MAADIIPFPKKSIELKNYKSVDLHYCWDIRLNNPLLNSIFKEEISYVERWYLQITHLLNTENINHPLLQILLSESDETLNNLILATEKDLAIHQYFADRSTKYIAGPNIKKLNRWLSKWKSLQKHRRLFYNS